MEVFVVLAYIIGAADTTIAIVVTALATVLAATLPGAIALRRTKQTTDRAAEREDFEALVTRWQTYADSLRKELDAKTAELESLIAEVRKIRMDHFEDRQRYERIIAELQATAR